MIAPPGSSFDGRVAGLSLLPMRPLALHPAYRRELARNRGALIVALLFLPLLALGWTVIVRAGLDIVREDGLWSSGLEAPAVSHEVTVRDLTGPASPVSEYAVTVSFRDEAGGAHVHTFHLFSPAPLRRSGPPAVRYDGADPGRCAFSWIVASRGGRWGFVGLGGAVLLLLTLALVLDLRRPIDLAVAGWRDRRAARKGVEVLCEVVNTDPVKKGGTMLGPIRYRYRTPEGKEDEIVAETLRPLLVMVRVRDADRLCLVGLRPAGSCGRPLLLRDDLYPLAVDDTTLAAVRHRLSILVPNPARLVPALRWFTTQPTAGGR